MMRTTPAIVLAAALSGWACSASPARPSSVASGTWGGDHIVMNIASDASHIEGDCAHGDVPEALTLDAQGRFTAGGTWVREHGGPIRIDETADRHPAVYSGSVESDSMSLTIRITDTGVTIGTFALRFGAQGRIVKCL
jgi:hypothetical protein